MSYPKLIIILLSMVCFQNAVAQYGSSIITNDKAQDLRKQKKIETITVYEYWQNDTINYNKLVYHYDTLGNILKKVGFKGATDKVGWERDYQYDKLGQLTEITITKDGIKRINTSIKYDAAARSKEETDFMYDGGKIYKHWYYTEYLEDTLVKLKKFNSWTANETILVDFIYNDKKQKIWEISTNEKKDTTFQKSFSYDDKGNLKRQVYYNADNTINRDTRYLYNEKNELVSMMNFLPDGKQSGRTDYTFENGVITSYKTFVYGKVVLEVKRLYDERGNFLFDSFKNERFTYNDNNLPVRMEKRNKKGKIESLEKYSYTYF